jgi:hypothetical protein
VQADEMRLEPAREPAGDVDPDRRARAAVDVDEEGLVGHGVLLKIVRRSAPRG